MGASNTIPERLAYAERIISRSISDATIAAAVAEFGYGGAELAEGLAHYEHARSEQTRQEREYGEQHRASDAVAAAREVADEAYRPLLDIARAVFKDDGWAFTQMQLAGARKAQLQAWLAQAEAFYRHGLADANAQQRLARRNITPERLQAGLDALNTLKAARTEQDRERSEAQQATEARDIALDTLEDWLDEYVETARAALRKNPQALEILGIRVRRR